MINKVSSKQVLKEFLETAAQDEQIGSIYLELDSPNFHEGWMTIHLIVGDDRLEDRLCIPHLKDDGINTDSVSILKAIALDTFKKRLL